MRVAVVFDMEGVSQIGDPRETLPLYAEYWRTGRSKLTDDIVAAACGLLEAGASEVVVCSHHGAGGEPWPNVLVDRLPDGVRLSPNLEDFEIALHADAMFQVGVHAPGGDPSFMSHTTLPGLRLRIGSEILSESHIWAWSSGLPLLGMVGSAELGRVLGSLDAVPFLAVQRSLDRANALPVHATPEQSRDEITAFAAACYRHAARRTVLSPGGPVRLEASVQNGDEAAPEMQVAGWARLDRTTFVIERETWRADDEAIPAAIDAAAGAAWEPYAFWFDELDPTSEATAMTFPAQRWARSDAMTRAWTADQPRAWFDPGAVDAPLEGLTTPI